MPNHRPPRRRNIAEIVATRGDEPLGKARGGLIVTAYEILPACFEPGIEPTMPMPGRAMCQRRHRSRASPRDRQRQRGAAVPREGSDVLPMKALSRSGTMFARRNSAALTALVTKLKGEIEMADDKTGRGARDRATVSASEPYEVGYFARKARHRAPAGAGADRPHRRRSRGPGFCRSGAIRAGARGTARSSRKILGTEGDWDATAQGLGGAAAVVEQLVDSPLQ